MPLKEILDPQGKAVLLGLQTIGLSGISEVRIGKHINLELEADDYHHAEQLADQACQKLLANLIMESYIFKINRIEYA